MKKLKLDNATHKAMTMEIVHAIEAILDKYEPSLGEIYMSLGVAGAAITKVHEGMQDEEAG